MAKVVEEYGDIFTSLVGSSIVLVQKKDGTWRIYIDYQVLNNITVQNRYPIPQIDDLLDQLKGENILARSTWSLGITKY